MGQTQHLTKALHINTISKIHGKLVIIKDPIKLSEDKKIIIDYKTGDINFLNYKGGESKLLLCNS